MPDASTNYGEFSCMFRPQKSHFFAEGIVTERIQRPLQHFCCSGLKKRVYGRRRIRGSKVRHKGERNGRYNGCKKGG